MITFKTTKHQTARGTRPDAEVNGVYYLLKKVALLRATYQVRLLAYRAQKEGKRLIIRVPKGFRAAPSLKALMKENPKLIKIEKSDH